jgi:hypothetical protein
VLSSWQGSGDLRASHWKMTVFEYCHICDRPGFRFYLQTRDHQCRMSKGWTSKFARNAADHTLVFIRHWNGHGPGDVHVTTLTSANLADWCNGNSSELYSGGRPSSAGNFPTRYFQPESESWCLEQVVHLFEPISCLLKSIIISCHSKLETYILEKNR